MSTIGRSDPAQNSNSKLMPEALELRLEIVETLTELLQYFV